MTLRQAAEAALTAYRSGGHTANWDAMNSLELALDAPDIADELAAMLRSVVHECDAVFVDVSEMSPEWRAIEAHARELLARYDAQKPDSRP